MWQQPIFGGSLAVKLGLADFMWTNDK